MLYQKTLIGVPGFVFEEGKFLRFNSAFRQLLIEKGCLFITFVLKNGVPHVCLSKKRINLTSQWITPKTVPLLGKMQFLSTYSYTGISSSVLKRIKRFKLYTIETTENNIVFTIAPDVR